MSYDNFVQTRISTPLSDTATEVTLLAAESPYRLPPETAGRVVITDSVGSPGAFEVISYASRSGLVLSGVVRGQLGTSAQEWIGAAYLFQPLMAEDYLAGGADLAKIRKKVKLLQLGIGFL